MFPPLAPREPALPLASLIGCHPAAMPRVRLNAGALTAGQLRVGRRGPSERIRPPGEDVNYGSSRDERLVCGWCGSRNLDASRPRRCSTCRTDQATVREATARLAAARLPPLGAKAPGDAYLKIRRRGDQARARLAERRSARRLLSDWPDGVH